MAVEKEWLNFFRDQYPVGSQIRLRELENPKGGFSKGQMGTLMEIDEDAKFHIQWEDGQTSCLIPGHDSFSVLPPEPVTLKLYMPLCAEVFRTDSWDGPSDEPEEMTDREILRYEDAIVAAMVRNQCPEEAERGIMRWYNHGDSVDEKVQSVVFTAEEREGKLWGVAQCRIVGTLSDSELETLKEYISGQASDGWGEGFEQREIPTSDGDMYVHLWNWENWDILTEKERFDPKLAEGLPDLCFSTLASTGELICIKRGERGYYPSDWSTEDRAENKALADYNNARLGVTDAQRKAMECGSMSGWDVPGADPAAYQSQEQTKQEVTMGGMQ